MKTTSTQTRVAGFFLAAAMSASVLGATVAGMQAGIKQGEVVTLDPLVVSAAATTAVN